MSISIQSIFFSKLSSTTTHIYNKLRHCNEQTKKPIIYDKSQVIFLFTQMRIINIICAILNEGTSSMQHAEYSPI